MAAITERESRQIEQANASGRVPVVFIHGLWLLPSSWDNWVGLFEQAGYAALTPASPANDNTPQIVGSAPTGTTIRLYANGSCSGAPIATVSVTALEAGVEVTVADDSTTSFSATATTAAENTSGCSAPRTYVADSSASDTQITVKPAALVKVATADFSFNGTDAGSGIASLECRLDSSAPATGPTSAAPLNLPGLAEGAHTFEVRPIDNADNTDATPATHTWTVD